MNRSVIDAIFVDQCICGNLLSLHGFPERMITNHRHHPLFQRIVIIIFRKMGLYYTEKSIYNGGR